MDAEPSESAGVQITLLSDSTPSLCRAPHCGEAAFPALCWTRLLLDRNFQESDGGLPPFLFLFHGAGDTPSFRAKAVLSRASACDSPGVRGVCVML